MPAAVTTLPLPDLAVAQVTGFMLVLARVGGLFVLAPVFSSKLIPVRVKMLLAFAISLALMPLATHGVRVPTDAGEATLLLVKELAVGLAFAFPMAAVGAAISAGASLLDTMVGFSFAAQVDPITNQQNAVLAQFYALFTVMVLLMTGGDQIMIEGLGASYRVFPITRFPDPGALAAGAAGTFGQIFVIGLEIAAPVVIALLISDAAFGLISRAVPQMNVFFVGLPAKILLGFVVISGTLPFLANLVSDQLQSSVLQALRILHAA